MAANPNCDTHSVFWKKKTAEEETTTRRNPQIFPSVHESELSERNKNRGRCNFFSGTGQKLEGGEGWCKDGEGHGFSCKHKREGQTIWCMSLRGGHYFLCKDAGVKESIYNSSLVTVILL